MLMSFWTHVRSIIVTIFLLNILCDCLINSSDNDKFKNTATVKYRSKNFSCKNSQPRAYQISDLMTSLNLFDTDCTYSPSYLVINRCDGHSGCCQAYDYTCMPDKKNNETLFIEYWRVDPTNINDNSKIMIKKIVVEQHVSCHCKPANATARKLLNTILPNIYLDD